VQEYVYNEDGTAQVEEDTYKKSYNWESSEEEGGPRSETATREEMRSNAPSDVKEVYDTRSDDKLGQRGVK
jgi:hypothetical protein